VITEHALLPVIPGREDDFERAFAEARAIITSMPGCRSLSLSRSIESPSNYLLLVEWEHLDDHTIGFRQSEKYQKWRTLLHHFYDPFPLVEHYQAVQEGDGQRDRSTNLQIYRSTDRESSRQALEAADLCQKQTAAASFGTCGSLTYGDS